MNRRETILGMLMAPFATLFAGKANAAEVPSGKLMGATTVDTLRWNDAVPWPAATPWPVMPDTTVTLYPQPTEPGQ